MNLILTKKQVLRLKKIHVSLVYLFGSYAENKSGPLSDVDIGIVFFSDFLLPRDCRKIYNELYDVFTDVFSGENIDIVFLQKAGLELCFDVITHGRILYEYSRDERLNFEEKITLLYADFKPILNEFNRAVLERISV